MIKDYSNMTLEEVIQYTLEESNSEDTKRTRGFLQLYKWLTELKKLRQFEEEIEDTMGNFHGYIVLPPKER